ncbi:MAG: AsmA-like C-terminal region-containing protein, partial [Pseudolabrys sp.]
ADLGGAAFSASGRIDTSAATPRGSINVDLTAPDMAPVFAILSRFAPSTVEALSANAAAMAPAKLQAKLTIEGTAPSANAKLSVDGRLGKVRLALNAQGAADAQVLSRGDLKIDGKLDADDGKMLLTMLGLDGSLAIEPGPGALTLALNGPASGDLRVDARLTAKGLEARATGTARPFAASPTASLRANIVRANAAPLRGPTNDDRAALPVTFDGRVALSGDELSISDASASIGGTAVRGKLAMAFATPRKISGDIEADNVDAGRLTAAAIGMPATAAGPDKTWLWSTEPFTDGVFGDFTGAVAFKARRLDVTRQIAVREFRSTLRLADHELTIGDMAGDVAGGQLAGSIVWHDTDLGLKTKAEFAIKGADAATFLPSSVRPPVTGKLDLTADIAGSGLSPIALIGSLQGNGKVQVSNGQLAGLDPRAFDSVTRAVDQGVSIDNARIATIVERALDSGQLSVKHIELPFAVSAGQLRLSQSKVEGEGADLAITGNVDLTDGTVDARLVLSGSSEASGARPNIFMALRGPAVDPTRSVDISALTGWLTLRSVENQAKRLKAMEAAQPKPAPPPPAAAVEKPATAPSVAVPAVPERPTNSVPAPSAVAPKTPMAPALPAPLDIKPAPRPSGVASPPAALAHPQEVSPQN